ncbi:hypothetical protein DM01DRAFT_1410463 [Hesseltinella vesiculosa]|uniref:Uncharacterized protein n=1 Tax=Hesseltinella vesiculosa TaxID=101127 RepID=A0A1X2G6Z6_9FUNG|nr:hypothetical protein DM01DRAFT_1410463 [Hesseltinella vesiculosa]
MTFPDVKDKRLGRSRIALVRWFGIDLFQPERAVTSYWLPTKVFLGIRLLLCLWVTIVLWMHIGVTAQAGQMKTFFAFFTDLTYIGLNAYLVTSCYHHVAYVWFEKDLKSFFKQPTVLNYLYVYLYHTVIVFNAVTPLVYWAFLSSGSSKMTVLGNFLNDNVHGVSFFIMLVDVIFNRMQVYTNMVLLLLVNVVLYMCLAFIVHAVDGIWVYPFLNWSHGATAAMMYLIVGLIFTVVFFIMMGIHDLRDWIAQLCKRAPKPRFSPRSMEWSALSFLPEVEDDEEKRLGED